MVGQTLDDKEQRIQPRPWLLPILLAVFLAAVLGLAGCAGNAPGPEPARLPMEDVPIAEKASGTPAAFTFDVMGDSKILPRAPQWRGNRVLAEAVREASRDHPELVFYTGDAVDQGGPIEGFEVFQEYMSGLNAPWYPVIGNHETVKGSSPDGKSGAGEANFRSAFAYKLQNAKSYYSFDHRGSHFVVLDTAWQTGRGPADAELSPGNQQWEWLKQDLTDARIRCGHIFIFGHKPPVTPFKVGGPNTETRLPDGRGCSWGDPKAAWEFMRLAAEYKVDAVFSGHIHMYDRIDEGGTAYIITAGAGAAPYAQPEQGGYFHYLRCRVEGERVSYEVVRLSQL